MTFGVPVFHIKGSDESQIVENKQNFFLAVNHLIKPQELMYCWLFLHQSFVKADSQLVQLNPFNIHNACIMTFFLKLVLKINVLNSPKIDQSLHTVRIHLTLRTKYFSKKTMKVELQKQSKN